MHYKSFVCLCLCSWIGSSRSQLTHVVNTTLGQIRGKSLLLSNVVEYLGVPYAEPITQDMRFMPPVQKKPFDSVYDATDHKNACFQDQSGLSSYLSGAETTDEGITLSFQIVPKEDCLFLNIYTPVSSNQPPNDLLPVMVFIHGGEFQRGTGSAFKGNRLADLDVVVVTINYRLGVFGFLSDLTDSFPANLGIHDQKMALSWIKNHIAAFGGDANSMTLFGEEAGGCFVHLHALSSGDNPMFRNVIIQSAHYDDSVISVEQCKDQFQEFISAYELSPESNLVDFLRNFSSQNLFSASQMSGISWRPCIDNKLIQDFPQKIIQNSTAFVDKLNLLIGTNADVVSGDGSDVTSEDWLLNVTRTIVTSSFPQLYQSSSNENSNQDIEKMAKNYLQFYSTSSENDLTADERQNFVERTHSDQLYKTWVQEVSWEFSEKTSQHSVYNYLFSRSNDQDPTAPASVASLSAELPFIFGYHSFTTVQDQSLVNAMMRHWTNFAKTGDPNEPIASRVIWPQYVTYSSNASVACRQSLHLNALGSNPEPNEVVSRSWQFWENYYNLLEFSCNASTGNSQNDLDDTETIDKCEPSVQDAIGLAVTNEDAAIMLIVFMCFTGLFLIVSIITSVCCCLYKKRVKKMKKRNKNKAGRDNPGMSEYKL